MDDAGEHVSVVEVFLDAQAPEGAGGWGWQCTHPSCNAQCYGYDTLADADTAMREHHHAPPQVDQ